MLVGPANFHSTMVKMTTRAPNATKVPMMTPSDQALQAREEVEKRVQVGW